MELEDALRLDSPYQQYLLHYVPKCPPSDSHRKSSYHVWRECLHQLEGFGLWPHESQLWKILAFKIGDVGSGNLGLRTLVLESARLRFVAPEKILQLAIIWTGNGAFCYINSERNIGEHASLGNMIIEPAFPIDLPLLSANLF